MTGRCLTSPCSGRAAARRRPRRERSGPRPAAEGQLVRRAVALNKVRLGVELASADLRLRALAHRIVELAAACPRAATQPRWSERHRPLHEARAVGWRSRSLCGGGVAAQGASARAPQRPTRATSFEGGLSGGCRTRWVGGAALPAGRLTSPCSRRAAARPGTRRELGGPRPAAEGQLVRQPGGQEQ